MIYLSSLNFLKYIDKIDRIEGFCLTENVGFEFSYGFQYNPEINAILKKFRPPFLIHNYFPPPQKDFVINLSSSDENIRRKSIEFCISNLRLSKKLGCKFYAAHSGFLFDPNPEELGKSINKKNLISRELGTELFLESLNVIKKTSENLEIPFLIENNVLTSQNFSNFGLNPFLCCEAEEIVFILNEINSPFIQLLLDTAHLKVSSNSLKNNLESETKQILKFSHAFHHSDNNGNTDCNSIIDDSYWFFPFLASNKEKVHVLETKSVGDNDIKAQINLFR